MWSYLHERIKGAEKSNIGRGQKKNVENEIQKS